LSPQDGRNDKIAAQKREVALWWALCFFTALAGVGWTLFILSAGGQL